jgi:hypothetical protein
MALDSQPPPSSFVAELEDARRSARRIPDFFIVGHAKSGTTAMHAMLRAHPQVYMPAMKETQFLARDPSERAGLSSAQGPRRSLTLEGYLALFEDALPKQRAGEASTTYLRTPEVADRIAALRPDARIIAILREPASFLHSLHLQLLEVKLESERDFARALALEQERRQHRVDVADPLEYRALLYSEHVSYTEQLRRFHERFGRDRVLVLIYDDFRRDNEKVMRRIFRFLEVDDSVAVERRSANPTVRVRSHRGQALFNAISVGRTPATSVLKRGVQAMVPAPLLQRAMLAARRTVINERPPPADRELIEELRRRFKPEVTAVSEYLGRDLVKLWGYEQLP